jgi:AcrR family transcriptional regulator
MAISPRPSTPTRRTWQRRSAARPAEIRAAALALFAERGYGGTTIEDIARAADITVGTIYRYFTDKSELLGSLVEWAASEPLLPSRPIDELRPALAEIWAAARRPPHGPVLKILVAEAGNVPQLVIRYRLAVLEPAARHLADLFGSAGFTGDTLLAGRSALGQLLGAGLLSGSGEPLVAQLDPQDVTIESIVRGILGLVAQAPAPPTHRPSPSGPRAETPPPVRRYTGPDAW